MTSKTKTQHRWTEAETQILRRDFRGTRASARALARNLDITEAAVLSKVQRMGLNRLFHDAPWTKEDDAQLMELSRRDCQPATIARIMKRKLNSIAQRIRSINAYSRPRDEDYSIEEVAAIMAKDRAWVESRISAGRLLTTHSPQGSRVPEQSLRKFLTRHARDIDGGNIDLPAIVTIVARFKPRHHC